MNLMRAAVRFALVSCCACMASVPALAGPLQCVPFARQVSGIAIHGNANTWWSQAEGRYQRGHAPQIGAVLAFTSVRSMRLGHVAMVSAIISDREVLLTHANWSRRGGIERDVRAIDVSAAGDWSAVRVWYGPIGDLGRTVYPTSGFIYADAAPAQGASAPITIAQAASPRTLGPDDARGIFTLVADRGN